MARFSLFFHCTVSCVEWIGSVRKTRLSGGRQSKIRDGRRTGMGFHRILAGNRRIAPARVIARPELRFALLWRMDRMRLSSRLFAASLAGCCLLATTSTVLLAQAAKPATPAIGTQVSPAATYDKLISGMEKEFVDAAEAMPEDKYN